MNKLVSRKPILRFKEGKLIQKFLNPNAGINLSNPIKIGFTSPSLLSNDKEYSDWRNVGLLIKNPYQIGSVVPLKEPLVNGVPLSQKKLLYQGNKLLDNVLLEVIITKTRRPKVNNSPFNFGGIQRNWKGSKGILDANVLEQLRKTGFTGKTALEAQKYLNDNFANVGLFGSKISTDNAWGNLSLKGFDAFMKAWNELQALQSKQQVSPIQTPFIQNPKFTQTPEFLEGLRQLFIREETPQQLTERAIVNNTNNLKFLRNGNYNKSQIRNMISQEGFDPYKYTGAQRKALRLYLNGESDDTSLLDGTDLARFTLPYRKQGGQLVSRNVVERFKSK